MITLKQKGLQLIGTETQGTQSTQTLNLNLNQSQAVTYLSFKSLVFTQVQMFGLLLSQERLVLWG